MTRYNTFKSKKNNIIDEIIDSSFLYVNRNTEEINSIFIICLMEDNFPIYNLFFNINGAITKNMLINSSLIKKVEGDFSIKLTECLKNGNKLTKNLLELFQNDIQQIPSLIYIVYEPKNKKTNILEFYELQYSYDENKTWDDVYDRFFELEKIILLNPEIYLFNEELFTPEYIKNEIS